MGIWEYGNVGVLGPCADAEGLAQASEVKQRQVDIIQSFN